MLNNRMVTLAAKENLLSTIKKRRELKEMHVLKCNQDREATHKLC